MPLTPPKEKLPPVVEKIISDSVNRMQQNHPEIGFIPQYVDEFRQEVRRVADEAFQAGVKLIGDSID